MTLYEIADSMISDDEKKQWLESYLLDPDNKHSFLEAMLKKQMLEANKGSGTKKSPPPKIVRP